MRSSLIDTSFAKIKEIYVDEHKLITLKSVEEFYIHSLTRKNFHYNSKIMSLDQVPITCKDAVAILFMFDLTSRCTLNSVIGWYNQARKWNQKAIPMLIGTKFDDFVQLPPDLQWTIVTQILHCRSNRCIGVPALPRDLKPENILLQSNGHVSLTDFDLSCLTSCNPQLLIPEPNEKKKHQKGQQCPIFMAKPMRVSNSFVGTEEYIAPNLIMVSDYDAREVVESLGSEGSDCGPMGLLLLSWFSISMVYSKALSCGGTVKPLDSKKASSEESVPWCTTVHFDNKRILSNGGEDLEAREKKLESKNVAVEKWWRSLLKPSKKSFIGQCQKNMKEGNIREERGG
ncbi:Phototropin-1B [Camellia lanceoleosa]|uniref:Phototropin-1B n=1 Tax=Camellia lanceoleosa TaxID=1840588 RepID=A0ACC0IHK0_9ERIC|nr:Phototropin-1B [Camellia lanceoleosa]